MGWLSKVGGGIENVLGVGQQQRGVTNQYNSTMQGGIDQLNKNYDAAKPMVQQGYEQAKAKYQTPEIAASRNELYQRVMGKGGYSPETVNSMKGNAIEQGGVQKRDAGNALNDKYGDASGGGMTGENLARAYNSIGATQANALRDVDVNQAQLQEQQQTEAIPQMYSDAAAQAGLDTGEAGAMAGLTTEQAKALAEMISGQAAGTVATQPRSLLQSII